MNEGYQELSVHRLLENLKSSKQVNLQNRRNAYKLYEAAVEANLDVRIQEYKTFLGNGFEYEVWLVNDNRDTNKI